ncbi:Mss4-like protein [Fusarium oxysporum f. sp. albedinis]|nr:Mss4-like protein [Fusarium oxysporum f. sp. albedinis]
MSPGIHNSRTTPGNIKYSVSLDSPDDARTSLCHCGSCCRAFGTNFGLTTKIALGGFNYDQGKPKTFKQENGVVREFCDNCGAFIYEYGFPPKGEFFCKYRAEWMPEVPELFHKNEIKE